MALLMDPTMRSLRPVIVGLLILLCTQVHSARRPPPRSPELRLFESLMSDYDPGSRPVINANHTVNVNFSLSLNKIHDLVEKNQTLITHVWILQEWTDERLTWSPEDYDGLTTAVIPAIRMWLPDIYIFNNADKGYDGFVTSRDSKLLVHNTGLISWAIPIIIKSSCAVDVRYFPFDNQHCFVRFGSWIYSQSQLDLLLKDSKVDLSPPFSSNTELDLRNATLERNVLTYDVVPGHYPQITMYLHIRRKPVFYSYTVIAPTLVLCILTLFSFLLPCNNGDKVGIGLTVFLSLYVLQLSIAENIPESNSLPLIGLFLTLVMTLNAISLVFATLVINIEKKGDRRNCPCVPDFVLKICKGFLSRITCTPFLNFYDTYGRCEPPEPTGQLSADSSPEKTTVRARGAGIATLRPRLGSKSKSTSQKTVSKAATPRDPKYEWFFVAEVLDKSLFFLFLIGMMVTIGVSLVVVPWLHRND